MQKILNRAIRAIAFSLALSLTFGSSLAFAVTNLGTNISTGGTVTSTGFIGDGSLLTGVTVDMADLTGTDYAAGDGSLITNLDSTQLTNLGVTTGKIAANAVTAAKLQNAAADLGAANVTVNLSNSNGAFNTNITTDGSITAGSFSGALTGNVTGNVSGNAGTVTNGVYTGDTGTVTSTMLLNNTVTAADLAAALSFADGDLLDLSSVNGSSTTEGLILPQNGTACSSSTAEGQICWDSAANALYVGDGAAATLIGNPFGASIDSSEITNSTIVNGDLAGGAYSSITGVGTLAGLTSAGGTISLGLNSPDNINIGAGTNNATVAIGGGLGSVVVDSATWDVTSLGSATFAGLTLNSNLALGAYDVSATTVTGDTVTDGTASLSGGVLTSSDALTLDAANAIELNSSGGPIRIGNDIVGQNIYMGTAGVRTLFIGNNTASSGIYLTSGSTGVNVSGSLNLGPATTHVNSTQTTIPTVADDGVDLGDVSTIAVGSTDTAGQITSTAVSHSTVTLTFNTAYPTAPVCVISPADPAAAVTAGSATGAYVTSDTASMTINIAAEATSQTWNYHCIGTVPLV